MFNTQIAISMNKAQSLSRQLHKLKQLHATVELMLPQSDEDHINQVDFLAAILTYMDQVEQELWKTINEYCETDDNEY